MFLRFVVVLGVVSLASSAGAQPQANEEKLRTARARFSLGQDQFNAHHYQEAVKEFLEAYKLSRKVDLLYNIALCYENLQDPGRMTAYLNRYLASRPDAPERTEVESKLYRLGPRVATLLLRTAVPGTEFWVDGEMVGLAPVDPVLLTEGKHHLEARHGEDAPAVSDVELRGGRSTEVELNPKEAGADQPPPAPPPTVTPAPVPALAIAPAATVEQPRHTLRWAIAGGAAAVVVVAAVIVAALFATQPVDFGARARAMCADAGCTVIDLMNGAR
jgi:hypothetical protein